MSTFVYLDNAASTPMTTKVKEVLLQHIEESYGNPSSMHAAGRKARIAVESARKTIANCLNCSIGEIFFTSCGTESNNTVIKRSIQDLGIERIITSPIEHPCIVETVKSTDIPGEFVNVDSDGRADLIHLATLLQDGKKTLVTLMHANNEVGSINDIEKIGLLCEEYGAYFHSDTVQTVGYYPIDLQKLKVHFISGSAHKFHGPKGIGFLYINSDVQIKPMIYGGYQERNMRAGTENTPYIQAMATALEESYENLDRTSQYISDLRAYAVAQIQEHCPEFGILNPDGQDTHYKILNVALPLNERSSLALMNMDIAGICVSAGSACSSGAEKGSHVFDHLFPDQDLKLIRLSFSQFNTKEEIDLAVRAFKHINQ